MATTQFPSNSITKREEEKVELPVEKKVEKVITGTAVEKQKGFMSKVKDMFISEDADTIGSYILQDIVVPAIKDNLLDIASRGVEMLLFGDTSERRSKGSRTGSRYYTSYDSYYRGESRRERSRASEGYSRSAKMDISDIILDSRGEAETVLDSMADLCETYHQVTVADLYDLVGISSRFTDNDYGWTSMRDASVRRTRDGYILVLPKPRQLD